MKLDVIENVHEMCITRLHDMCNNWSYITPYHKPLLSGKWERSFMHCCNIMLCSGGCISYLGGLLSIDFT